MTAKCGGAKALLDLAVYDSFTRLPTAVLYGYLALLAPCLPVREYNKGISSYLFRKDRDH